MFISEKLKITIWYQDLREQSMQLRRQIKGWRKTGFCIDKEPVTVTQLKVFTIAILRLQVQVVWTIENNNNNNFHSMSKRTLNFVTQLQLVWGSFPSFCHSPLGSNSTPLLPVLPWIPKQWKLPSGFSHFRYIIIMDWSIILILSKNFMHLTECSLRYSNHLMSYIGYTQWN